MFNPEGVQLVDEDQFAFKHWWVCLEASYDDSQLNICRCDWPEQHLDYMQGRAQKHGSRVFSAIIALFKWSLRNQRSSSGRTIITSHISELIGC